MDSVTTAEEPQTPVTGAAQIPAAATAQRTEDPSSEIAVYCVMPYA